MHLRQVVSEIWPNSWNSIPQNFKPRGPPQYDVIIEKHLGCKLCTPNTTNGTPGALKFESREKRNALVVLESSSSGLATLLLSYLINFHQLTWHWLSKVVLSFNLFSKLSHSEDLSWTSSSKSFTCNCNVYINRFTLTLFFLLASTQPRFPQRSFEQKLDVAGGTACPTTSIAARLYWSMQHFQFLMLLLPNTNTAAAKNRTRFYLSIIQSSITLPRRL